MRAVDDSGVQRFEKEAVIHLDAYFSTALKMTNSQTEAEDLVQETYLRAFRFYDRFQKGTNCKYWLFGARRKLQEGLRDRALAKRLCAGGTRK